ncbi:MAG: DnaJ domain-containing protein [Clostridia bacterium]|nr:DnaJ domain-containing protein [Clostridia bacterium]
MTDPYQVLGVAPTASDDEVKKAYRKLCKIYHPDANVGKPDAAQAEKKFIEVQQAYEEIMHRRQGGGTRAGSGYNGQQQQRPGYGGYQGQYQEDPFADFFGGYGYGQQRQYQQQYQEYDDVVEMRAAQNYIDTGHYAEAINALGSVPAHKRNARWYYLNALAQAGLHNVAQALEYARQAVSMEPGNMRYQQLLSQLQSGGSWYGQRGQEYGRQTVNHINPCCSWMLIYFLCSCCGVNPMMCYPFFCCL